MNDRGKTRPQLLEELAEARQELADAGRRIAELEEAEGERRRMEEALRESQQRYKQIVELAPDGIITTNLKGVVTSCNTAFLELSDYSRDEIVGVHMSRVPTLRIRDIPTYTKVFFSILRGKRLKPFEFRWVHKDGTVRWGEAHVSLLKRGGKTTGVQAFLRDISDRKTWEEELESERSFLTAVLDNIEEAIVICNAEGTLIQFNEAARRLHGLPEQLIPPDRWADHYDLYRADGTTPLPMEDIPLYRALQGERVHDAEIVVDPEHSEPRHLVCNGQTLTDERGELQGAVVAMHDITDRERAMEALRESENKFRTLVDNIPEALFLHDLDARILDVNQTAVEQYGHTREELLEMTTADIDPDYERREDGGQFWSQLQEEGQIRFEARHRRKEGTVLPVGVSLSAVELQGDKRILALAEDITERREAEQALRESEARFRDLVEHSFDLICTHDLEGRLLSVNPAAESISGYTAEELVGANLRDHLVPETRALFDDYLAEIESKGEASGVMLVNNRDGEQMVWEYHNSLRVEGVPEPIVRGTARDITERKRAQEELRQQERLATVGQLAAGIAHDFRNILATVILFAQMDLKHPDLPPQLAEHLHIIIEESHKATDLVQQILDFSSRAMITREPLDLRSFVARTLDVLRRTIPESVRISLALAPSQRTGGSSSGGDELPPTVLADPGRLQQALTNLALNARDAMPEGGELRLGVSRLAFEADERPRVADMEPGAWVCLTVSDSGEGMTDEVREHLFEPFFTTKEVGKGTGLGLAQVYGILRQH